MLPSERRALEMTDGDYLYCILNMWIEAEKSLKNLCPSCRDSLSERTCLKCGRMVGFEEENPGFDEERFKILAEGESNG